MNWKTDEQKDNLFYKKMKKNPYTFELGPKTLQQRSVYLRIRLRLHYISRNKKKKEWGRDRIGTRSLPLLTRKILVSPLFFKTSEVFSIIWFQTVLIICSHNLVSISSAYNSATGAATSTAGHEPKRRRQCHPKSGTPTPSGVISEIEDKDGPMSHHDYILKIRCLLKL